MKRVIPSRNKDAETNGKVEEIHSSTLPTKSNTALIASDYTDTPTSRRTQHLTPYEGRYEQRQRRAV